MPNHCTNLVTLVGAPALVARVVELLRGADPTYSMSESERRVLGEDKKPPEEYAFCFHKILPVPAEVLKAGYSMVGYNWQSDNWGTKWGAYDFDDDVSEFTPGESGHIHYKFDTAWAPPIPIFDALAARFPELRIYHSYGEEFPTRGRSYWIDGRMREQINDKWPKTEGKLLNGMSHLWREVFLSQHPEWVQAREDAR